MIQRQHRLAKIPSYLNLHLINNICESFAAMSDSARSDARAKVWLVEEIENLEDTPSGECGDIVAFVTSILLPNYTQLVQDHIKSHPADAQRLLLALAKVMNDFDLGDQYTMARVISTRKIQMKQQSLGINTHVEPYINPILSPATLSTSGPPTPCSVDEWLDHVVAPNNEERSPVKVKLSRNSGAARKHHEARQPQKRMTGVTKKSFREAHPRSSLAKCSSVKNGHGAKQPSFRETHPRSSLAKRSSVTESTRRKLRDVAVNKRRK